VGLELGPLSLVSATEQLLGRKSRGYGLKNREYGRRGCVTLTTRHPLSAKVGTNFTERSVGIVRSWTQETEFFLYEKPVNPINFL
jgi:hypothetical protein